MANEKQKALDIALLQIRKDHGEGAIMKLGEAKVQDVKSISTGAISLDIATGIGGVPRGRIIEIYGPESSGKTTLTLHIVAEAQKAGGTAVFIDAEHAMDPVYAKKLGVNVDELLISQPDSAEEALQIADTLIRSGAIDVLVIDSVAALAPRAELEGEMGDAHVGLQARLMSQALRKLTALLSKSHTSAIFINQIREKIGVMFGSPETTPGGRALKFYSSMRLDVRRVEAIKSGDQNIGNKVKVKVVKNKTAQPFREGFFDIIFGEGISTMGSMVDVAVEMNILDKAGTWISFGETKMGQGREAAKTFLKEHPEVYAQIEKLVKQKAGLIAQDVKAEAKDAKAALPATATPAAANASAVTAKVGTLTPAGAAALAASKKEAEKAPEKPKIAASK
ncbi:MAG TPA: recombinase RecA [bacterium]|nr:recombinase RecA [bacterium]